MVDKDRSLHDQFLRFLRQNGIEVTIVLDGGIRLKGQIMCFDQEVVLIVNTTTEMVYRKSIAKITPYYMVNFKPAPSDGSTTENS